MVFIEPTQEQLERYADLEHEGPIVICNILKFKPGGGARRYNEYSQNFAQLLKTYGGKILFTGRYLMPVIGDDDWHMLALVEYPSLEAFISLTQSKEYQEMKTLRADSLVDSRAWALKSNTLPTEWR